MHLGDQARYQCLMHKAHQDMLVMAEKACGRKVAQNDKAKMMDHDITHPTPSPASIETLEMHVVVVVHSEAEVEKIKLISA
ncbi:hypothetical protein C0995_007419, partial [Termitomyces sp. Mi166